MDIELLIKKAFNSFNSVTNKKTSERYKKIYFDKKL